jgi:hypothetical protein
MGKKGSDRIRNPFLPTPVASADSDLKLDRNCLIFLVCAVAWWSRKPGSDLSVSRLKDPGQRPGGETVVKLRIARLAGESRVTGG